MKTNQFVGCIIKQGDRRLIEIPKNERDKFEKVIGKPLKITIDEI
jgi:hypothetical protein